VRGAIVTAVLAFAAAFGASGAVASTDDIVAPSDPEHPKADSGWQAGTCKKEPPEPEAPNFCSVATKGQYFEQAAGHPRWGFTQIIVRHEPAPIGKLKTVRVDLPIGLTVNPLASTQQCTKAQLETQPTPTCPAGSKVGKSLVWGAFPITGTEVGPLEATVYNIFPDAGEPARFGFSLAGKPVYLRADVAWESDYHEGFTIDVPRASDLPPSALSGGLIVKNRLVFEGRAGDGTFVTTPSTCFGEAKPDSPFTGIYSTWLLVSSVDEEAEPGYDFPADAQPPLESRIPLGTSPKDCETVPFDPSIAVDPNTSQTDSPAGGRVEVKVPFEPPSTLEKALEETKQSQSHIRSGRATLPLGMGLNPSAANGLVACSDDQFNKGSRTAVECPEASRIGMVEVDTPPLPDGSLIGPVYVGRQLDADPASGNLYRIFVLAESARYGISVRLLGKVSANPQTGQLTTTFDDEQLGRVPLRGLPQAPIESARITFNGGPKAPLTSPPTCGPNTTTAQLIPWSSAVGPIPPGGKEGPSTEPPATPSGAFSLSSLPGGGACPKTLAERPFSPRFGTHTTNKKAGGFTSLEVDIARADGQQELKGVDITLPPGHTAKLAGLKYCPATAIVAAAANSGAAEAASSSCPASSFVGTAAVKVGTGPEPLPMTGKAFLAGPYKGAPLSLAIVTPATAGPFDLGTVVERVALFVDRRTAQIHAVSDPIPHIFGGALLDLRSAVVKTTRPKFSINPTSCSQLSASGTLRGGGANPADPAAFSSFPVSSPFKVNDCDKLGFKPKLFLRLFGAMRRAKNPKLRAVFVTRDGDANPARAAVTLPRSLFLDQSNISRVCTRVQYDAHDCPKNSRYGFARAFTPLLDKPLEGPVYLRSSDNELPDMVASLRGQVDIDLVGRIDSVKGRIRNTFDVVPDVPVSKFVLTVKGGRKGLLTNSRNQCPKKLRGKRVKPLRAIARIKGQNGKKANQRPKLRRPCGKGKKKGKRGSRR
jgi:hypothetical protein